jgi:Ca2+-binding RTX toxin-like protein
MATATALESYMLNLINSDRAKAGVAPLKFDGELNSAADSHSAWMDSTDTLSHTGAGGSSPGDRIKAAGYDGNSWAENVAYASDRGAPGLDQTDVGVLHTNLMNSPGHRANLLKADMADIGIGLRMDGKSAYVTEVFGKPTSGQASEPDDGGAAPAPAPSPAPAPIPVPVKPVSGIKVGTPWADKLVGTGGNDTLIGGKGADILTGGAGKDTFVFKNLHDSGDKITDFKVGLDLIDIRGIKAEMNQYDTKAGIVVEFDTGAGQDVSMVTLLGVHQELGEASFVH